MRTARDFFAHGVAAGMLLVFGAEALHWFITPAAHPAATPVVTVAMTLQAVVGLLGAGAIAVYRSRVSRRPDAA